MVDSINIKLECKLLHPLAKVPTRARVTDAGYDLYSVQQIVLRRRSTVHVETGIALSAPPEFYYTIEGRSGLGLRGVTPFRGIIDATYCGQVIVILHNDSDDDHLISVGDRIAQICLHQIIHAHIEVIEEFSPNYNTRGTAGFGSSGS